MGELHDKLMEYAVSDVYPFHMPGHKRVTDRSMSPYSYDITEVEGFDNLHNPQEILKSMQDRMTTFYESMQTFVMVNGSTGGLLSAISACFKQGDRVMIARNCHKAVYNAVYLNRLVPVYIYPENVRLAGADADINGCISPEKVERLLRSDNQIKGIVLTSPTYEGIVSDINAICRVAHKRRIPVIVDEAHGAHFDMHGYFPKSALSCGADVVIQSLHKTLPALTQTAVLHYNSRVLPGEILSEIKKYLSIYQTTSPSYVLMDSADECMSRVMDEGEMMFQVYTDLLDGFRKECKKLTHILLADYDIADKTGVFDMDRTRLVFFIKGSGMTGKELYDRLLKTYHIQLEMASGRHVVAISTVNDTKEGFDRLFAALTEIDRELRIGKRLNNISRITNAYAHAYLNVNSNNYAAGKKHEPDGNDATSADDVAGIPATAGTPADKSAVTCFNVWEVEDKELEDVPFADSVGKISAEYVYLYPPGIPVVVPGEMMTASTVAHIEKCKRQGYDIYGTKDGKADRLRVLRENFSRVNITDFFGGKKYEMFERD